MSSNSYLIRRLIAATALLLSHVAASAQLAKPAPVDVLFGNHLTNVAAGTDLNYKFERTVNQPDVLGQPFTDDIKIEVKKVGSGGTRDVVVKIFSGERARDPHPITDMTGNPVLVVFLDRAVASYMAVAGGKVAYLKDKFRTALRERSTIEPVKIKLGDKTFDGHRVSVAPYSGDINAAKMRGYENSQFSFVMSEAIPGQFVELVASYDNPTKTAPRLEERTIMVGAEVLK